jgi:transcriptional regulator GlxA family with amidase domain
VRPLDARLVSWLESTADLLGHEMASPKLGSASIVERLTDVLLVQAVRWQLARGARDAGGWIRALEDPQIREALGLIHEHPEEQWTVESLAARVAMSRSAFAARFRRLAGEPPLRYLTRFRINRASELLRAGSASLAQVATLSGYSSSAALSKAFKRWVGTAPAAARGTSLAEDRPAAAGE